MYIRVAQVKYAPNRSDEALATVRELGIPGMRAAAGIGNAWWAMNRETGQAVAVSTWDTLEHASQTLASPELQARLQALGVEGLGTTIYEMTDRI
jgi:hypothetical protein